MIIFFGIWPKSDEIFEDGGYVPSEACGKIN